MGPEDGKTLHEKPGKLFYAVVQTDHPCDFGPVGLDNQRVYSIPYKDIGALVSDYPRVRTIKLLRKNIGPYHAIIQEAVKRFTTIPAKFPQIARDAGEVALALQRNYSKIRSELDRLTEKVEMGVKVWWTAANLLEYFISKDPEIRIRRDGLRAKPFLNRFDQIRFGEFFQSRIDRARKQITDLVLDSLPPAETKVEDVSDEGMATNALLLIRKDLQPVLQESVRELACKLGSECRLALDGPWPPFSFVNHVEIILER